MTGRDPARLVKTTKSSFEIIEKIKENEGITASVIGNELGLATSTVHDHLVTLEELGFIIKDEQGYKIGLKFLDYGTLAKNRYKVAEIAKSTLKRLANKTNEFVWFYVEEHGSTIAIAREKGENAVRSSRLGRPLPMHCTVGGKAMLAHYPRDRVNEIIDQKGLPAVTEQTITDRETLFAELETIREQGYALNDEESKVGLRAVGGAIMYRDEVFGAVSVPGPKHRMNEKLFRDKFPNYVLEAINEIELNVSSECCVE